MTEAAGSAGQQVDEHFVRRFTEQMPPHIAATFSDEQLRGVVQAFGLRRWVRHKLDIRFTLPILGRTWYFVILAGLDRRPRERNRTERLAHPFATAGNLVFLFITFLLLLVTILGILYVLKSAVGLDLMPGASLGIWGEIQNQVSGP